jgi:hypothetical protein
MTLTAAMTYRRRKQEQWVQRWLWSRGSSTLVRERRQTRGLWVAACMALSSMKSTWPLCLTFVATCLTSSIGPAPWDRAWTCSSMLSPMHQLGGNAPSVRKLLPSWLGSRGRRSRTTGHLTPRFLCSWFLVYLVPSLLCYCFMYIWTVDICPGFLRAGQMLLCLTFYHATWFYVLSGYSVLPMLVSGYRQHFW